MRYKNKVVYLHRERYKHTIKYKTSWTRINQSRPFRPTPPASQPSLSILDLGGTPKVEAAPEVTVFTDPVEYIKSDVAVSHKEVPVLQQLTLSLQDDFKTFDILKAYALDEEEDMYWSETQLELIEKIGLQNWLIKQL